MLQIDHVYEFLYQKLFKDFDFYHFFNGVPELNPTNASDIAVFTPGLHTTKKIFLYDQEPFFENIASKYLDIAFFWPNRLTVDDLIYKSQNNELPYGIKISSTQLAIILESEDRIYKQSILVTSEYSQTVKDFSNNHNLYFLYYFFHGFAAVDWYRGYYALNFDKTINKDYKYDFVSYNRIINGDRSYRIYWVSRLVEMGLLDRGQVSFNVTDNSSSDWQEEVADLDTKLSEHARQHVNQHLSGIDKLVVDRSEMPGSASADIPRTVDACWHIVTETVFYYDKLHLTEKIFKPIVSKQPFMLIAAPGNLAYLRRYGFKTFDGIIDESYDLILNNDQRIDAVAEQLHWYCNLSVEEKQQVIERLAPIVEYNFHHFYGEFRHIITQELLDNCKILFKEIGYDDSTVAYNDIYKVLTR